MTLITTQNEFKVPVTKQEVPGAIAWLEEKLKSKKGEVDNTVSLDIVFVDAGGKNINIKNVDSVVTLLKISSSIHAQEAAYNEELKRYELETQNIEKFNVSEKSVSEWEKILGKAIHELINKVEIEALETSIKEMSEFLGEDQKLQNALSKIGERVLSKIK